MQFGRDSSGDYAGVSLSYSFVVPISLAAAGAPSGVGGGEVGVTILPESLRFAQKTRRARHGARRGNQVWKDEKWGAEKWSRGPAGGGGREGEEGKKEQVSYERADLPSSLSE